jgi:hypothetical protein
VPLPSLQRMGNRSVYLAAAGRFADLVDSIPVGRWQQPGLGEWDLRALVGHTSRALTTVLEYLQRPAEQVVCGTAADYLAAAAGAQADPLLHEGIAARGVAAGAGLGDDPAAAVHRLVTEVAAALPDGDPLITTFAGGMRLEPYLQTRVFELTVHSLDLTDALGTDFAFPADAVEQTLLLLTQVSARSGRAAEAIRLLTGRGGSSFSLLRSGSGAR